MIEINLLPQEMRKKEPRFKPIELGEFDVKNIPIKKIAIMAGCILLSVHALLFTIGIYSKSKASTLSRKYNTMLTDRKVALDLKAQIDLVNKKIKAIDELMVKRFGWAKKLNDLSDSMTSGIWLSSLEYDEKTGEKPAAGGARAPTNDKGKMASPGGVTERTTNRYLILSGYASSMGEQGTSLIGKFIKSLKDNAGFYSDFGDIELGSIKAEKIQDQEVMSFKLTCMFKGSEQ